MARQCALSLYLSRTHTLCLSISSLLYSPVSFHERYPMRISITMARRLPTNSGIRKYRTAARKLATCSFIPLGVSKPIAPSAAPLFASPPVVAAEGERVSVCERERESARARSLWRVSRGERAQELSAARVQTGAYPGEKAQELRAARAQTANARLRLTLGQETRLVQHGKRICAQQPDFNEAPQRETHRKLLLHRLVGCGRYTERSKSAI